VRVPVDHPRDGLVRDAGTGGHVGHHQRPGRPFGLHRSSSSSSRQPETSGTAIGVARRGRTGRHRLSGRSQRGACCRRRTRRPAAAPGP
jgi:hypothetical protein